MIEIALPGDPAANIYQIAPIGHGLRRMVEALRAAPRRHEAGGCCRRRPAPVLVFPRRVSARPFGWPIVYDCMDDHSGFLHNSCGGAPRPRIGWSPSPTWSWPARDLLYGVSGRRARASMLVRNACEYEHFFEGDGRSREASGPVRIGYYGAIAEWFDGALVAEPGRAPPRLAIRPDRLDPGRGRQALEDLPNVRLLGERPYGELPRCVADWDAFIIPFRRMPLTEATNPVKVYEMLAMGKPVVAVACPS